MSRNTQIAPTGADLAEAQAFLKKYPDLQAIDVFLTDCHGIGRGKTVRRHELEGIYTSGRALPLSLFGQDVRGVDVDGSGLVMTAGGGDKRCWPIPGTLGYLPHTKRGQLLITMFNDDGTPVDGEPRPALLRQINRAKAMGLNPMGAFELEFYLVDPNPTPDGRYLPAPYALTKRQSLLRNTMSVDELDEMSPLFDAIYDGAAHLGITLETVISEYGPGQYEMTIRYRDLLHAADDVIIAKRLIRTCARRFGMEACFMPKPFGTEPGSGMHLHLSMADENGSNLFADQPDDSLSPMMLNAIGGLRQTVGDTMLVLAPFLNSWRRFASTVYSPASDDWGVENRNVAIRVPGQPGKTRHFEHRVAGVDANPYMVATVTLAAALDGIENKTDPGAPCQVEMDAQKVPSNLPRSWLEAIDRFDQSAFARNALGDCLHTAFAAIKRAEYEQMIQEVSRAEWDIYGFTV
ncbi:glutamine synthetase family protein [Thalassospira sp. TSL5-1]|uniref:glutamine synthetase family protein n=1 Tax=Thalassospira sp. TSL5-1 TaxID=1544451 RepID=UPI00094014C7|nr:glutamine synthetase family protein [Thalassospira sp. TSL5-1]OKH88630.1 glutamine synthetase [Thalassospira sp. TSL5-1]